MNFIMDDLQIIENLSDLVEWALANSYEVPIGMPNTLTAAAERIKSIAGYKPVKVFLSFPIYGRDIGEIEAEIEYMTVRASCYFLDEKVEIMKRCVDWQSCESEEKFLTASLEMMADADFVIFSTNAMCCRHCKLEEAFCRAYDIEHKDVSSI